MLMSRCCCVLFYTMILQPDDIDAAGYLATPANLSEVMELAGPGDIVELEDGIYEDSLESVTDGEEDSPITVIGGWGAIIKSVSSPSVLITHSYIHLVGFSVDGLVGSGDSVESYTNKCVWIEGEGGSEAAAPLNGFVMHNMSIQNCGSECVRLKDFVTGSIISTNTIQTCGVYDFQFDEGEKNGEGIYIGTSSNQWTYGQDGCNFNYVSGNTIETNGNECVDIKEGSTGNVVEHNVCSNQLDENSGCFDSRGDANTFRYNKASECAGTGVRLGGWEVDGIQYGQSNNVYGNEIVNAGYGALKVETESQGLICGNVCEDGACEVIGKDAETIEADCFEACNSDELIIAMEEEPSLSIAPTPSPVGDSST